MNVDIIITILQVSSEIYSNHLFQPYRSTVKRSIMKLRSFYFNELNEEQRGRIMDSFCENNPIANYLDGKYSYALVNAQVAVDENFILYDIKVFDPFYLVEDTKCLRVHISWFGWSNWLFGYRDKAGHGMDKILYIYGGETQDN